MGKYRKRFNEKARSGMLAKQAALKKARNKQLYAQEDEKESDTEGTKLSSYDISTFNTQDSNAEILAPVSEEERLARKRALEENLYSQNAKTEKLSRSKKKRLDKYIEHQLKREEKKTLLAKLAETKVDTSKYSALKELGKGKLTKKEQMIEALELERQGRGDDHTKEILYEERDVEEFDEENIIGANEDTSASPVHNKSSFLDNRPSKFGGSGFGFGFSNIPVIRRDNKESKKKYTWRKRVEDEENKKLKIEAEKDFESDSDSEVDDAEEEDDDDDEIEDDDEDSVNDERNGDGNEEEEEEEEELVNIVEDEDDEDVIKETGGKKFEKKKNNKKEIDHEQEEDEVEDEDEEDEDEEEEDEDEEDEDEEDEDEDDDDEDEEEEEEMTTKLEQNKPRHSNTATSFKEWAEQQLKKSEGRENIPLIAEISEETKQKYSKPSVREEDFEHSSDEEGYIQIDKNLQRKAFVVNVQRSDEIQKQRLELPIFAEEHKIMEAIYHHDCVILCGETGSGKTTQIPQFLYEAGFGNKRNELYPNMIGITQPRRVAAVSMSERVGNELGDHKHRVGHQIRFDTSIKNEGTEKGTVMKFMTDGVLLREMMKDFLLTKYSALIIDEAHERNINTDILIGMLTRVLKLRRKYHEKDPQKYKPLKVIIMSATLRIKDFSENTSLFKVQPPIINVQARQYPVSIHFNKKTEFDYQEEALKKACKIHRKLPPGGILIFMTGQSEITNLVKKLKDLFPSKKQLRGNEIESETDVKLSNNVQQEAEDIDFSVNLADQAHYDDFDDNESEVEEEGFEEAIDDQKVGPLHVLPLYSLLPTNQQMKVFEEPPRGSRLCIVSTNVAETSLTIPGIKYVIDCGRSKEKKYNQENGVTSFEIDWISKASADQRAGRAGRTSAGHCYRLYSSAVYEEFFPQFSVPEILRTPFESIVLSMKSMGIDQIVNFPFPTPPDRTALKQAEELLVILGALDNKDLQITDLGRKMSLFPLSPRFSKILIMGNQQGCLQYIIAIVAALSVGDPFISETELIGNMDEDQKKSFRTKFYQSKALFAKLDSSSECMISLSAVCALDHISKDQIKSFISNHYLRQKIIEEIQKLRKQLSSIVERCLVSPAGGTFEIADKLAVPNKKQVSALKQMIASGFIDHVAIRGDLISSEVKIPNKSSITNVPYCPVMPIDHGQFVYIHGNSVMTKTGTSPNYLVYKTLSTKSRNSNLEDEPSKIRMTPLVDISGKQLANIAKKSVLLTFSKPLGHPYAPVNITPTKRECYVVPRFGSAIGSGGVGWDLPAMKVTQIKSNGQWITL
ncbi:ECM16 [Candida pseudojiufengensis]|uniref:ECM16 n=1 Tax=Candida pseudojiufengensis TaxID=497109 RepID=UPI0022252732|nr:ECM16 [Candida pseudojiufengensis]KAI5964722.1 ECM16 [Candida pseudojiufengensis]